MIQGIYEELVTKLVSDKLDKLDQTAFYVNKTVLDKEEAASILSSHLARAIKHALSTFRGDKQIESQIALANKIIVLLKEELMNEDFNNDLISVEGEILTAIFNRLNAHFADFNLYLHEITPYTRLTHSELFTGGNVGLSLESELKKEILSSDEIDLLVSFIKFKGVIILEREFREFAQRGGRLRVITTTYMGASDYKAIQLLSKLPNTQVKMSFNTGNERLHAKAYLFKRNTGFHTAYIGSSNFSRSALTDGLEWNLKMTTREVGHIIDKFQKTFETYWQNDEFELYDDSIHKEKLKQALEQGKSKESVDLNHVFFDIKPYPFQSEILEKLDVERSVHHRTRNLVVAATGTGKTVVSAFDYKKSINGSVYPRLLFIAHRMEILKQSLSVFRAILRDNNFGELWVDGLEPTSYKHVFASVQTLKNRMDQINLTPDYFDFIVIDECHHMTASSYRGIINYFTPKILLGLTATPERMDGGNIQEDFHNRIAAEIRLPEAMNRKLLCPFQYFGITDSVDLSNVRWEKGRYVASELSSIYTANDRRVKEVILALEKYTKDPSSVKAIGFCVSIEHAKYMAEKFAHVGFRCDHLTSANSQERDGIKKRLLNGEINYLFVVDIFNEGVDIPQIDTVLFLRPTESLTIFLQQLGRGLRLAENKECLTVLDFVGNSRPEYNFDVKFRALIGKTNTTVKKEIEDNFPRLPLGCSIVLEPKAKDVILKNIAAATSFSKRQLLQKIQSFEHQTELPFCLKNFVDFYKIPLQVLYERGGFQKLCFLAGKLKNYDGLYENEIIGAISQKWLSCSSISYFKFILGLAKRNFQISESEFNAKEKKMLLMLHYDVWRKEKVFGSLESSILEIGRNSILVEELIELLGYLIDEIGFKESDVKLPYDQPLKLHARYTRDQILAAFGISTFEKKFQSREGVAVNKMLNTELLFINLVKADVDFSPTTMYDDYAVSETLFHWQTQNTTSPSTKKGVSYIKHKELNKKILLFIRERNVDEYGNTMGYVFVGEGNFQEYYGSKPMSIIWELNESLPNYLYKDAVKLRVG